MRIKRTIAIPPRSANNLNGERREGGRECIIMQMLTRIIISDSLSSLTTPIISIIIILNKSLSLLDQEGIFQDPTLP